MTFPVHTRKGKVHAIICHKNVSIVLSSKNWLSE